MAKERIRMIRSPFSTSKDMTRIRNQIKEHPINVALSISSQSSRSGDDEHEI